MKSDKIVKIFTIVVQMCNTLSFAFLAAYLTLCIYIYMHIHAYIYIVMIVKRENPTSMPSMESDMVRVGGLNLVTL